MASRMMFAEIKTQDLRDRFGEIPRGLFTVIRGAIATELARFHAAYTTRRLSGATPGESLGRRTGNLARSFMFETTGDRLENLRGRVYFDSTHITVGTIGGDPNTTIAHVHEFGSIITPKRAEWLTVPLEDALTPAGVARGSIQDFPDGRFIDLNEDDLSGLFYVTGPENNLSFLFALLKQVEIKPSLHFREDWNANRTTMAKGIAKPVAAWVADWNEGRRRNAG